MWTERSKNHYNKMKLKHKFLKNFIFFYKCFHVDSLQPWTLLENWNRCIRVCSGKHFVTVYSEKNIAFCDFLIKKDDFCWAVVWDL